MKKSIEIAAVREPSSAGGALAAHLVQELISRYGWRDREVVTGREAICFIGADSVDAATALVRETAAAVRPRMVLVGVEGSSFQMGRLLPAAGSVAAMLESFQLAGAIPRSLVEQWRPELGGFVGRKDLMEAVGTNCFKALQSKTYCQWVSTPGSDLIDFLGRFVDALTTIGTE